MYPQADFLLRRWKEMAQAHPGLARKQSWKAVAEGDQEWLAGILAHVPELTRGVAEAYAGITVEMFEKAVRTFFETARHPVLGVPYTRLAYHADARADRLADGQPSSRSISAQRAAGTSSGWWRRRCMASTGST